MAVFVSVSTSRYRWSIRLAIGALVATLMIGVILWRCVETASIVEVRRGIDAALPVATVVRFALISVIVIGWRNLLEQLKRRAAVNREQLNRLINLRWRLAMWLVGIELVLGQNLVGQIARALQGEGA